MGFFSGILTKLQIALAATVAVLLPILYVIGRRDGARKEKVRRVAEALEAEQARADFYKNIESANNEAENNKPRSSADLTDRLREHGL